MPAIRIMPAHSTKAMELYRVVELVQPQEFKFKYPFVVYKYVKNKYRKPIYTAFKQFRTLSKANEYVNSKTSKVL